MKIILLCITLVLFALPALAATYTWEDDQGTVNFTEDLGNVPAKYRKKVKIVGEEELLPSVSDEPGENPPAKIQVKRGGGGKGEAGTAKDANGAVYGGKEASDWKAEYATLDADVKVAEKQLEEFRNRLNDTSQMSRSEYLSIQATIRSLENSVLMRKQKLEDLRQRAAAAGVPDGLME